MAAAFKGVEDPAYLQYHGKYVAHGSIAISVQEGDTALAKDSQGRILMSVRRLCSGGILLMTTLDPDYHTSISVPGPSDELVEDTHRKALHLLDNIVDWAAWAALCTPKRGRRLLFGLSALLLAGTATAVFYFLPLWLFLFLRSSTAQETLPPSARVAAVIGLAGSLASIYTVVVNFVAKGER